MSDVAKGVLTMGLGGGPSNMIVGQYSLGPFSITIEILPPQEEVSLGGGAGKIIPRNVDPKYKVVRITIKYRGHRWNRLYYISLLRIKIIVKVLSIINKITTKMSVSIRSIKQLITKVRIKR